MLHGAAAVLHHSARSTVVMTVMSLRAMYGEIRHKQKGFQPPPSVRSRGGRKVKRPVKKRSKKRCYSSCRSRFVLGSPRAGSVPLPPLLARHVQLARGGCARILPAGSKTEEGRASEEVVRHGRPRWGQTRGARTCWARRASCFA